MQISGLHASPVTIFPKQLPRRCCSRGCSVTPINVCCKQRRITCCRCYDKGLLICQINCTRSNRHISTSRDIPSLRYGRMRLCFIVLVIQMCFSNTYGKVMCTLVQALRLCTGRTTYRGSSIELYPFMTTAVEGDEGSASRPGRSLPPGKTRYPMYRRLGGPQGRSGQVRKISPQLGFDPWTVQSVASRYND